MQAAANTQDNEHLWRLVAEPAEQRLLRMAARLGTASDMVFDGSCFLEPLLTRCRGCRSRVTCTRWIVFGGRDREMAEFCPNATHLSRLPKLLPQSSREEPIGMSLAAVEDERPINWRLLLSLGAVSWVAISWVMYVLWA
jgi:hypothetical protein